MINKFLCSISVIMFLLSSISGQVNTPVVNNVRISATEHKVTINYDLDCGNSELADMHNIRLSFITKGSSIIKPESISGDIGDSISCGRDKSVTWEVSDDMDILKDGIKPYIR